MARTNFPSDKQDQFMLRMPDGMRDKLKAEAAANKRSLNAEIVARLEGYEKMLQYLRDAGEHLDVLSTDAQQLSGAMRDMANRAPDRVLYVALDARGFPISWTEIMAHLNAITKAGGITFEKIEAKVFHPEMINSDEREMEWWNLVQHYRALAGLAPLTEADEDEADDADDDDQPGEDKA